MTHNPALLEGEFGVSQLPLEPKVQSGYLSVPEWSSKSFVEPYT